MSYYPSDPAEVAAELRRLADQLETVSDLAPAVLAATVDLQIHGSFGDQGERTAAVDRIAEALERTAKAEGSQYRSDQFRGAGRVDVRLYTALKSGREQLNRTQ